MLLVASLWCYFLHSFPCITGKPVVTSRGLAYCICVFVCVCVLFGLVWLIWFEKLCYMYKARVWTYSGSRICALNYSATHSHKHASFHCFSQLNCPLPTSSSLSLYHWVVTEPQSSIAYDRISILNVIFFKSIYHISRYWNNLLV